MVQIIHTLFIFPVRNFCFHILFPIPQVLKQTSFIRFDAASSAFALACEILSIPKVCCQSAMGYRSILLTVKSTSPHFLRFHLIFFSISLFLLRSRVACSFILSKRKAELFLLWRIKIYEHHIHHRKMYVRHF